MVKRFKQGEFYTLCLAKQRETEEMEVYTYCVNVVYVTGDDTHLMFKTGDSYWFYNKVTKVAWETDLFLTERTYEYVSCTNIIEGWIW